MCESHVSNPQTVGKCCSLLNSLPPSLLHPTPSLPRSPFLSDALSWRALFPLRPPASVCVCARACPPARPGSTQEVSAERLPALLCLELPLPADSFYANTRTRMSARAHTHLARRPPRLPVRKKKKPKPPRAEGRLLFLPLSLDVYICIPSVSSSSNTKPDISSLCLPACAAFEDPEPRLHAQFLPDACQRTR